VWNEEEFELWKKRATYHSHMIFLSD